MRIQGLESLYQTASRTPPQPVFWEPAPTAHVRMVAQCHAYKLSDPKVQPCQKAAVKDDIYCRTHWDYDPVIEKYRGVALKSGVSLSAVERVMNALLEGVD